MDDSGLGTIIVELRRRLLGKMREWGWGEVIAKQRQYQQTLLDHSLTTYDVLSVLIVELQKQLSLERDEILAMLMAAAVHDAGKEREAWQQYARGERPYVPDTDTVLSEEYIRQVAEEMNVRAPRSTVELVRYHMASSRDDASDVLGSLMRDQDLRRWSQLSRYVYEADNVASCPTLEAALAHCHRTPTLAQFWTVDHHRVRVRGTVTPILHEAAQEAFVERGWRPLLYYPTGTLYVASRGAQADLPRTEEILATAADNLAQMIVQRKQDIIDHLMVGSITQTFMPKPELFDYLSTEDYLLVASQSIGTKNPSEVPDGNAAKYATLRNLLDAGYDVDKAHEIDGTPKAVRKKIPEHLRAKVIASEDMPDDEVNRLLGRMGEACKEIAVFKFFKSIVESRMTSDQQAIAAEEYEQVFGEGAFTLLRKTSTLMYAKDLAFTVDYYWSLPGSFIHSTAARVEHAPQEDRIAGLVKILGKVARTAFEGADAAPTTGRVAEDLTEWVARDLIHPDSRPEGVRDLARQQLEAYSLGKKTLTSKRRAPHVCPICNDAFEQGVSARADFSDGPERFTNRAVPYSAIGDRQICYACYAERILRQIALGRKARELVYIFPRRMMGAYESEAFLDKVREMDVEARAMKTRAKNPERDFSAGLSGVVARNLEAMRADVDQLSGQEMARLFSYSVSDDRKKRELRSIRKMLDEQEYSLTEVKAYTGRSFGDMDSVAEAIWSNEIQSEEFDSIRRETVESRSDFHLIARTANGVVLMGSRPRQPDRGAIADSSDSPTNAALKRMLFASIMGLGLRASVAALDDRDVLDEDMVSPDGLLWLEPVPGIQQLLGQHIGAPDSRWIPLNVGWRLLDALVAACGLINRAEFPARSDIHNILSSDHPGKLLRRIEQKTDGSLLATDIDRVERVFSFTHPELLPQQTTGAKEGV